MSKILLTGVSGFIGSRLYKKLLATNTNQLVVSIRAPLIDKIQSSSIIQINAVDEMTNWSLGLQGTEVVIHLAARVHVMNDNCIDPLAEFRKVNVEGTLNLARQAAAAGVKRFIFISSIKVNGEQTRLGHPYKADDVPAPIDPYGVSKMEAEQCLQLLAAKTGMEVVIIRPVLVYGPGVKANFLSMMNWLHRNIPLPLGAINNKRSLVALDNLVDLIITCTNHPNAANQIFLVSDQEDLSTTELLHRMAKALNKPAWLLPIPARLLELSAMLVGKRSMIQRLCGSLQVDIRKTQELLGWVPPVTVDDAFAEVAQYFQENIKK